MSENEADVKDSAGGKTAMLPETGEGSHIIPSVICWLLILFGLVVFQLFPSGYELCFICFTEDESDAQWAP